MNSGASGIFVAFWLMNVVPTMLYIVMYLLMFAAAVRLRYSHPDVPRRYRVPFGNAGIWILAVTGTAAGIMALVFGFIPTAQVGEDQRGTYVAMIATGFIVFTVLPFLIHALRRPDWCPGPSPARNPTRPVKTPNESDR